MALLDNVMQQVTPVVLAGTISASGEVSGGVLTPQSSVAEDTIVTDNATTVTIPAGKTAMVQNLQTTVLYVKKGASASASVFSHVLSACTALNDGLGGSVEITKYTGTVSFFAASGSPRAIVSIT